MTAKPPRLKWHMLRRRRADPPFLRANLEAGLKAGAALEVDLAATADGHFFCLHDQTLDRETDGVGPASALSRAEVMLLLQRAPDGSLLDSPPLFLDEVVAATRRLRRPEGGLVQLDVKVPAAAFDVALARRLGATLSDTAPAFVASGYDWSMIERIAAGAPGIVRGFDPLEMYEASPPRDAAECRVLAERTRSVAPGARIYYLEASLVLGALRAGVNMVEMVGRGGAEVDAWTVDADRPQLREDLSRLIAAGVDQITSNDPAILRPLIEELR